ncbi:hypothetical protein B0181_05160 [Moraxella caviae]|uniref:Lipoprotein n=1 Tax=Moraxella caviae TaxID=34060 RepID=A0A1T0A2P5_9GAMM|nr:hypothetical protein [Moraxella caviae]OOR90046.1 hypothetical protein B0181_05160 [Moraxella caviae]STZ14649.1 Uncharacterised protein [Moraxella caviae]VEW13331.1 Uncharacterised protein [Moraxella caviae]
MKKLCLAAMASSLLVAGCASMEQMGKEFSQVVKQEIAKGLQTYTYSTNQNTSDAVDFTEYVNCYVIDTKECDYDYNPNDSYRTNMLKLMTPAQRASIVRVEERQEDDPSETDGGFHMLTLHLKNATAYGVPIEMIEFVDQQVSYGEIIFSREADMYKVSRQFPSVIKDFTEEDPSYDRDIRLVVDDECDDGYYYSLDAYTAPTDCRKAVEREPLRDRAGKKLPALNSLNSLFHVIIFNLDKKSLTRTATI